MQIANIDKIKEVWSQQRIPVIYRKGKGHPLLLRLPFKIDNRAWLQAGRRTNPEWNHEKKYWIIPKAWFNDTIDRSLARWGKIYIIQPHRDQEICASACWNAKGHECQCSCMGANHGQGSSYGWYEVTETFAVRWQTSDLACRLLTKSFF